MYICRNLLFFYFCCYFRSAAHIIYRTSGAPSIFLTMVLQLYIFLKFCVLYILEHRQLLVRRRKRANCFFISCRNVSPIDFVKSSRSCQKNGMGSSFQQIAPPKQLLLFFFQRYKEGICATLRCARSRNATSTYLSCRTDKTSQNARNHYYYYLI